MYVNLKQLKHLSAIKTDIRKDTRNRKILDQDIHHGIERLYKPVIEPLMQIVKERQTVPIAIELIKEQPAIEQPQIPAIEAPPTPQYSTLRLGRLADRYLKTPSLLYDHAYGIKPVEGSTSFRLGRMDVQIEGDDFTIDGIKYVGTEGLWKLLTLKNPRDVPSEDLDTYKEMLVQTKAFLIEGQDRVKCNRGDKYKTIIKPIADEWKATPYSTPCATPEPTQRKRARRDTVTGLGVVLIPSDPNELVARHRILFGAYQAGNTGVYNELQAINDKLLALGVFDIEMIRRLNKWRV
jgi:hypothetical protein